MPRCLSKFCNHVNPIEANFCEQCGGDLSLDRKEIEARDFIMEMFNTALEGIKDRPKGLENVNRRFIDYYIQKNGASLAMKFMEVTADIVAKGVKKPNAVKPVPKGLYGLFFQRLHTLPKTSGGIIKFPDVFRALSQLFPITKENAWEILFLMRDFGLIEVIAGHGIRVADYSQKSGLISVFK